MPTWHSLPMVPGTGGVAVTAGPTVRAAVQVTQVPPSVTTAALADSVAPTADFGTVTGIEVAATPPTNVVGTAQAAVPTTATPAGRSPRLAWSTTWVRSTDTTAPVSGTFPVLVAVSE